MDYVSLTESGLSPSQVNTITTKARWIENIRDDIIELPEGSSAYIDISDKKYNTKCPLGFYFKSVPTQFPFLT